MKEGEFAMRHDYLARATLLIALPLLGGCQSLFGQATARTDFRAVDPSSLVSSDAEGYLAIGRQALDEGRYAAAIDAFRFARLSADSEAAAYNGLAIAYSQLGRKDLTERFFRRAVTLAPNDQRYRRNFALFLKLNPITLPTERQDQPAPVRRPATALLKPEIEPKPPSGLRADAPVRVEQPRVRLVAGGAGHIKISSDHYARASDRQPRLMISSPRTTGKKYPVKISFLDPSDSPSVISMPEVHAGRNYPVRVKLQITSK